MAHSIESLTQQLAQRATDPFSLAIVTGMTSSSFLLFGGLGLALDGAFPAVITESERVQKGISDTSALKLWAWMFNRARVSSFSLELHRLSTNPLMACLAETLRYISAIERHILFGGFSLPPRPTTHLIRGFSAVIFSRTLHARSM